MSANTAKTIIIGAGPAGLMAAGSLKYGGAAVLEKNEKAGKKLYITGKGRCNLTNDCSGADVQKNAVTNPKFLFSALNAFPPREAMRLFESCGVPLKTERGGRVFPASDKASDVTAALKKYALAGGAQIRLNAEAQSVWFDGKSQKFHVRLTDGAELASDSLIIATGGKSYPATGSTGDGYRFAKAFGHTVVPPRPALVPLVLHEDVKPLEGLSLENVSVSVSSGGKTYRQPLGEMVFTAQGASGPCILSLSSLLSRDGLAEGARLSVDLKPGLSAAQLEARILRDFEKYKNKQLKNALFELLPKSLISYIIGYAGLDGETAVHSVTKPQRAILLNALKSLTFTIKSLDALEKGIVTGGGVSVGEINPKTLESKLVKNLYFAGEVLDVDALTGGYNIQIALSTGYLAGSSITTRNAQRTTRNG